MIIYICMYRIFDYSQDMKYVRTLSAKVFQNCEKLWKILCFYFEKEPLYFYLLQYIVHSYPSHFADFIYICLPKCPNLFPTLFYNWFIMNIINLDDVRVCVRVWIFTNLWAMAGDSFLVMSLYRKYRTIPDFLLPWLIIASGVIVR